MLRIQSPLAVLLVLGCLSSIAPAASGASLRGPAALDISDNGAWAAIAFQKDDSVAVVNLFVPPPYTMTNLEAADGIGRRPVAVRCIGSTAIVLYEYDTKLTLIDLPTASVSGQVDVPMYAQDVVWDPVQDRYFVSVSAKDAVFAYDGQWSPIGPAAGIATGRLPGPLTIGPDGRLYVGNRRTWDVSVLDVDDPNPALWAEVARVHLGSRPEDLESSASSVFVTHHGGGGLTTLNGIPQIFNDQAEIENILTEIDPLTLGTTDHFVDQGADYAGIDINAGKIAFAGAGSGTVHVADLPALSGLETVDLLLDGPLPGGTGLDGVRVFTNTRDVAVDPNGHVFAVNFMRDSLVELRENAGQLEVFGETALNAAGVPITADDPSATAVNLSHVQQGERYLNTIAAWKRGQTDFTCATCHPSGGTDRRLLDDPTADPLAPPGFMQGVETFPSLGFLQQSAPFGWEAVSVPLPTFNALALIRHDVPIPGDTSFFSIVAWTIGLFQTNIRPGPSPHPVNEAGRDLFMNKGGCVICHVPPIYSDNNLYNIGTPRTVNIPPLVSVWNRDPYLHDGRAATLEELMDNSIYDTPNRHGNLQLLNLQERRDLADFVRSLGPDICLEIVGPDVDTGLRVGKAPCPPTQIASTHRDFIRTTLGEIVSGATSIDLGPTTCLADEHEVRHLEDAADPGNVGNELYVFLARDSGPGETYGTSSDGRDRLPASGDCPDE